MTIQQVIGNVWSYETGDTLPDFFAKGIFAINISTGEIYYTSATGTWARCFAMPTHAQSTHSGAIDATTHGTQATIPDAHHTTAHQGAHGPGGSDQQSTMDVVAGTGKVKIISKADNTGYDDREMWIRADGRLRFRDGVSGQAGKTVMEEAQAAGGELAGTYPNPTVAATHAGSAHHASGHAAAGAPHTFPGGTTTFLRADGTFAAPTGGTVSESHISLLSLFTEATF